MKKAFITLAVVIVAFFTSSCEKNFNSGYSVKFEFTSGVQDLLHCEISVYDHNTNRETVLVDQYNINKSYDLSIHLGYRIMPGDDVHIKLATVSTTHKHRVFGTASIYYNGKIIERCPVSINFFTSTWLHWATVGDYSNN